MMKKKRKLLHEGGVKLMRGFAYALFIILSFTMACEKDNAFPGDTLQYVANVQLYNYQYIVAKR